MFYDHSKSPIERCVETLRNLESKIELATDSQKAKLEHQARHGMDRLIDLLQSVISEDGSVPEVAGRYLAERLIKYKQTLLNDAKFSDPAELSRVLHLQGTKGLLYPKLNWGLLALSYRDSYREQLILIRRQSVLMSLIEDSALDESIESRANDFRRESPKNKEMFHDPSELLAAFHQEGAYAAKARKKWPIVLADFQYALELYLSTSARNARKIVEENGLKNLLTSDDPFNENEEVIPDKAQTLDGD